MDSRGRPGPRHLQGNIGWVARAGAYPEETQERKNGYVAVLASVSVYQERLDDLAPKNFVPGSILYVEGNLESKVLAVSKHLGIWDLAHDHSSIREIVRPHIVFGGVFLVDDLAISLPPNGHLLNPPDEARDGVIEGLRLQIPFHVQDRARDEILGSEVTQPLRVDGNPMPLHVIAVSVLPRVLVIQRTLVVPNASGSHEQQRDYFAALEFLLNRHLP
ncbi:single-stranded DNA-binding protein [Striga asiatica]|uniref:Single-stranded DNA-binding protein n=1 Tax=Striga asiatica TaxID=4170 RepID=A0A5A7RC89_STRAF|nr:single-stranded DNA-binding protein [Striga asiatica]